MLLSIITVTSGSLSELNRTLDSILSQTFIDWECVVVDGGISEEIAERIENLNCKKISLISEKDNGISDAFNKGLLHSKGEWVIFLNGGDCFCGNDILNKAKDVLVKNVNSADVVYGDYLANNGYSVYLQKTDHLFRRLSCSINHQSAFIKRNLHLDHLYNCNLKIGMDYDMWLRILQSKAVFEKLQYPISIFEIGGVSSNDKNILYNFLHNAYIAVNAGHRKCNSRLLWDLNLYSFRYYLLNSIIPPSIIRCIRKIKAFVRSRAR